MTDAAAPPPPSPFDETSEVPERALRIYARLWQLETWLRRMAYLELRSLLGDEWAASLNTDSHPFRADKRLTHMPSPEMNALSYSQLSALTKLIGNNWSCFESYFPPRALWDAKLEEISQIRNRSAHFRVSHSDDHPRLLQFLRDIDKGFWTFCTSYNNPQPLLQQANDPVAMHFLSLDPFPWTEVGPNQVARVGIADRSLVIAVAVEALRRPWTEVHPPIDGTPGYLYDVQLTARDARTFDYSLLLQQTRKLHQHVVHICLDATESGLRITLPAVLGAAKVVEIVEAFLDAAGYAVGRSRNPVASDPTALADEWPEYVLGPRDPLTFLGPDMPCSFFGV